MITLSMMGMSSEKLDTHDIFKLKCQATSEDCLLRTCQREEDTKLSSLGYHTPDDLSKRVVRPTIL